MAAVDYVVELPLGLRGRLELGNAYHVGDVTMQGGAGVGVDAPVGVGVNSGAGHTVGLLAVGPELDDEPQLEVVGAEVEAGGSKVVIEVLLSRLT